MRMDPKSYLNTYLTPKVGDFVRWQKACDSMDGHTGHVIKEDVMGDPEVMMDNGITRCPDGNPFVLLHRVGLEEIPPKEEEKEKGPHFNQHQPRELYSSGETPEVGDFVKVVYEINYKRGMTGHVTYVGESPEDIKVLLEDETSLNSFIPRIYWLLHRAEGEAQVKEPEWYEKYPIKDMALVHLTPKEVEKLLKPGDLFCAALSEKGQMYWHGDEDFDYGDKYNIFRLSSNEVFRTGIVNYVDDGGSVHTVPRSGCLHGSRIYITAALYRERTEKKVLSYKNGKPVLAGDTFTTSEGVVSVRVVEGMKATGYYTSITGSWISDPSIERWLDEVRAVLRADGTKFTLICS